MILIPGTRCSVVSATAADDAPRETQRNVIAKDKALEHKKNVLSVLNHAAQTYASELTARWRSLTNLYDTMILVHHCELSAPIADINTPPTDRAFAAF